MMWGGEIPREQKGMRMKNLNDIKNSNWAKDHLIICGIPDGKAKDDIKKQIVETGSVKMTDLAKAMGINVVEQ